MKYDCRKDGREPGAAGFPCAVKVVCAQTGARIPNVFFLDTEPATVGRFLVGGDGLPLVASGRKKRFVDDGRGGTKLEIYYDRLEVWERRPWKAVALASGAVVAQSEGLS